MIEKKIHFLFFSYRNLQTSNDTSNQLTSEVITMNNDYCHIDAKTLKRKPIHRAGFFFYKRGSLRSTREVYLTSHKTNFLIYSFFRIIND
jgi:hypothetical protein